MREWFGSVLSSWIDCLFWCAFLCHLVISALGGGWIRHEASAWQICRFMALSLTYTGIAAGFRATTILFRSTYLAPSPVRQETMEAVAWCIVIWAVLSFFACGIALEWFGDPLRWDIGP